MRVGRRRAAVLAGVLVALAAGTGVARAYYAPGAVDVASPNGYFSFCGDRQRDTAGITAADLGPTGGDYRIDNYVYDQPGPLVGADLAGTETFVLSKSGIESNGVSRRVLTTQRIEYADAARTTPVQIRCKMRTHESLVRPQTEKQRFDNGTASPVPWGFGPQAATGTPKTCVTVQEELVAAVWASLTPAQQAAAPYKYGTSSLVFGPTSESTTGTQWTLGEKIVTASSGVLTIADRSLNAPVGTVNPIGDRILGAYYCTFVAPDYIRGIFLGTQPVV
jgi:hypothetical protein